MNYTLKDGWHTIHGEEVYTEGGQIIRGRRDGRTTYLYKLESKYNAWVQTTAPAKYLYKDNYKMS